MHDPMSYKIILGSARDRKVSGVFIFWERVEAPGPTDAEHCEGDLERGFAELFGPG